MLVLYSRQSCPLCDEFEHALQLLADEQAFSWQKIDVDSDPSLQQQYGLDVPVLTRGEEMLCQHFFDKDLILKALA